MRKNSFQSGHTVRSAHRSARWRATGSCAPQPHAGGVARKLAAAEKEIRIAAANAMSDVYAVRCNFSRPDLEERWHAWYSGPKLAEMMTHPFFLSGQRYRAAGVVPPGCPVLPANEGEVSATVSVTDAGLVVTTDRARDLAVAVAPVARTLGVRLREVRPLDDSLESLFRELVR